MFAYCVHELRFSEDAAYKRIRAARTARQFPAIFPALAEGRLHLAAVVLLTPYLTPENADELLASAAGQTKAGVEQLLAERFPRPEMLPLVEPLPVPTPPPDPELAPGPVEASAPGRMEPPAPPPTVKPQAPQSFTLHLTLGQGTHEKLQYAQDLLGHALPSGDLAGVLDQALDALIEKLEKVRFAATPRPRPSHRPSSSARHVPAHVRRAVWERDGGQCTFVSESGHRCPARKLLEYDHIEPVARGGQATVAGIRLRCRGHNQYAAVCTFGAEFMRHKRQEARRHAEVRRKEEQARARAAAAEVTTPLRLLGFRADEARAAATWCERIPEASLEERVRAALSFLSKPRDRRAARIQPMPS